MPRTLRSIALVAAALLVSGIGGWLIGTRGLADWLLQLIAISVPSSVASPLAIAPRVLVAVWTCMALAFAASFLITRAWISSGPADNSPGIVAGIVAAAAWWPAVYYTVAAGSPAVLIPVFAMALILIRTIGRPPVNAPPSAHPLLSLTTSTCLQIALVSFVIDAFLVAALAVVAVAVFLKILIRLNHPRPDAAAPSPWTWRWTVNAASVAALVVLSLTSYNYLLDLAAGPQIHSATLRDLLNRLLGPRSAAADSTRSRERGKTPPAVHPGVILHLTKLVDLAVVPPRPVAEGHGHGARPAREAVIIPFAGVYWFYRPPDHRPPPSSITVEGSPDLKRYLSLGSEPIRMEARQNLGRMINLDCCMRIDLALRNADSYLGSVEIELVLVNSSERRELSLGRSPLSRRPRGMNRATTPLAETMPFLVPPARLIREFDEFRVVFHLGKPRTDRSAKTAVDHFALVPASL